MKHVTFDLSDRMKQMADARANYESRATEFDNALYRLRNDINALLQLHHEDKEEYPELTSGDVKQVESLRNLCIDIENEMRGITDENTQ